MNAKNLKYYIGIIAIILLDSLHNLLFENNQKFDVYLFYEHKRYLTNILYDVSNLFKFSLLTFWLIRLNKGVFKPLFITSLFIWILYFFFYNQKESIIIIPIYILLIYIVNPKTFFK